MHYFYVIYSKKVDHYYIGETMDLERRRIKAKTWGLFLELLGFFFGVLKRNPLRNPKYRQNGSTPKVGEEFARFSIFAKRENGKSSRLAEVVFT